MSRWRLPVRAGARVVEIHRPADWVALVAAHPAVGRRGQEHWELPSANQQAADVADLLAVDGQAAARASYRWQLVPDWASVAAACDGVHLSWAGFLTAEGYVSDLGDGGVAMLRYWFSERTHWLADVFGEPEPLAAPVLDRVGSGVDVRVDAGRRAADRAALAALLGR